jgi:hypothetical protein
MATKIVTSVKPKGGRIMNNQSSQLPSGRVLMIHPAYVHYTSPDGQFVADKGPFLPISQLYAGELIERKEGLIVEYFDCQLYDLKAKSDLAAYECFGISVMGAQDIAAALVVYTHLTKTGIAPARIYIGGQGVEKLTSHEYARVFPYSNQVPRQVLSSLAGYMDVVLNKQIDKLSDGDLRTYLSHELTLLFSQGCMYGCSFCGAQTRQSESFYNTNDNLDYLMRRAQMLGLRRLEFYCTSLDFFQQALPGQDLGKLTTRLEHIIELQNKYGIKLQLRALTRANSYNTAMCSEEVLSLVKQAGFYKFGFGADGAASLEILKAMRRGTSDLKSDLITAFDHAEDNGFIPEMLYVFGIPEDTEETLRDTRDFLVGLLKEFPHSQYRGFPAKNEIPGNRNWTTESWRRSESYGLLLSDPRLFLNLGFETLANAVSHPDPVKRKRVNHYAINMSLLAHEFGRVQSYLTVPLMLTDGQELMDGEAFTSLVEIIRRYTNGITDGMTLAALPEYRQEINRHIPKDR